MPNAAAASAVLLSAAGMLIAPASGRAQPLTWTRQVSMPGSPGAALAQDTARGRTVMVRGDETWEFDGRAWERVLAANPMGRRVAPGMAYDAGRGVTVLFGGAGAGLQNDTWEWDGATWSRRPTANSPSRRWATAMAYDTARGRVVLFGGTDSFPGAADTWEYDGTDWLLRRPATTPPPRGNHALVYDSARRRIVMFGGRGRGVLRDTWEWDGSDWLMPVDQAPATDGIQVMAYDSRRARTVLFAPGPRETWEYDGSHWHLASAAAAAPVLHNGAAFGGKLGMAFDPARGVTVMADAQHGWTNTWNWNGADWEVATDLAAPREYSSHSLAFDERRGAMVMFGGIPPDSAFPEAGTWERFGGTWVRRRPTVEPPPRSAYSMAWDPNASRVLLFGGVMPGGRGLYLADTWHWDGTSWIRASTPRSPSPRSAHALAADTGRGRVVLFGGLAASGTATGDTWEWDGTIWTPRATAVAPSARAYHAMVYDSARARTVLFGGQDRNRVSLSDTWEWDGTTWMQHAPATSPLPLHGAGLAYDRTRGRTVLFGGLTRTPSHQLVPRADTWEWDGTDWTLLPLPTRPPVRLFTTFAYDPVLRRCTLVGSGIGNWDFGPVSAATTARFGTPCGGGAGVPSIRALGLPQVGNPFFVFEVGGAWPGTVAALGLSPRSARLPLGYGCELLVSRPELHWAVTRRDGSASFPVPLPNTPALRGAVLYAQGIALDPNGALGGTAVFTQGLRTTVD